MTQHLLSEYDALAPLLEQLSPDRYYEHILQYGMDTFRTRIEMAGFHNLGRVLDAGCGYGQWSVALAERNSDVVAFDRDSGMVEISRAFANHFGRTNLDVSQHDLNVPLPYSDASFDAVWCWGVIMFVNRDLALREFHRVLKPGGRLMLGAVNSYGRWLLKLLQALKPSRPDKAVAQMAIKALLHGKSPDAFPSLISTGYASRLLAQYGFDVDIAAIDGHIDISGNARRISLFPPRFLGIEGNIEVLARKRLRVT